MSNVNGVSFGFNYGQYGEVSSTSTSGDNSEENLFSGVSLGRKNNMDLAETSASSQKSQVNALKDNLNKAKKMYKLRKAH